MKGTRTTMRSINTSGLTKAAARNAEDDQDDDEKQKQVQKRTPLVTRLEECVGVSPSRAIEDEMQNQHRR
jgi:hypothetical protein